MVMSAYIEEYLDDAQDTLGNLMDYAINLCGVDADKFFYMFISSGVAKQFQRGNPRYISGMSGGEIAKEIIEKITGERPAVPEEYYLDKSPEYWCGWMLAYYQWKTGRSFKKIYQIIKLSEIIALYPTHHEADIERAVETMDILFDRRHTNPYFHQIRKNKDMSIEEIADRTSVDLAVIQSMDSEFDTIQSIDSNSLYKISCVLGCTMEDLMEI